MKDNTTKSGGNGLIDCETALCESIKYLNSPEAEKSVALDPYWPKWNSPWWHMTLLYEMGLTETIPYGIMDIMIKAVNSHYLHYFPFTEADAPAGTSFLTVMCHCALGTIYKIAYARGIDADGEIPWAREWFLKYQLPDGGLNCDEAAYTKPVKKSSMVSTMAPLEAILCCSNHKFNREELDFLDKGAEYLISHRLFKSSSGRVIDENWLKLCFPRFYEYDVLRGLSFLARWASVRNKTIDVSSIEESVSRIKTHLTNNGEFIVPKRLSYAGANSFTVFEDKTFIKEKASTFELLKAVSSTSKISPYLTNEWNEAKRLLNL